MNIQEVEKEIVAKILAHYSDFDNTVISIYDYTLTEITGFTHTISYFKNNAPLNLRTIPKISNEIGILLNLMFKKGKKTNKCTLTIYPNGEYESSFIWDEVAHLGYLVGGIQSFISFIIEELTLKILQQFPNIGILWNESVLTVPFVKGKIQPLQTKIKTQEGSIEHSILVNNVTSDESPWLSEQFEDMYHMTNEGDLKGVLSGNWNVLTIRFDNITGFNFDRDVSFEWREKNT